MPKQVIDINLTGVFQQSRRGGRHGDRRARPHRQHRLGRGQGRQSQRLGLPASKAASSASLKSLGKELATTGVLVNCVAPAVVKTELFSQMTEEHIHYMLSKIPMNRFGEVDEVS
jgi:3-oxoacyl-[acyl-carrier protein] reductase